MSILETRDGLRWPSHELAVPVEIGEVRGTTQLVGLSGVVFDSPASFAVGNSISFVITIKGNDEGVAPMRLECSGRVIAAEPDADARVRTTVTMNEIRVMPVVATPSKGSIE